MSEDAPHIPNRTVEVPSTVLSALRVETRSAHDALSRELAPEVLCTERRRYAAFLASLYGFHVAAEQALAAAEVVVPPPVPARSALIAGDLAFLGVADRSVPIMPWSIPLTQPGAAWGVVYVVEGSALGGRLLAKLARRNLGLGPARGADFFTSGGASDHRWRRVKAELAVPADVSWAPTAVRSAAATFEVLRRWMVPAQSNVS